MFTGQFPFSENSALQEGFSPGRLKAQHGPQTLHRSYRHDAGGSREVAELGCSAAQRCGRLPLSGLRAQLLRGQGSVQSSG